MPEREDDYWIERPLRTLLFTPGNRPERMARADGMGADAVVFDLEDAVPRSGKVEARALVKEAVDGGRGVVPVGVRVTAYGVDWEECVEDLYAVVSPGVDFIVAPKVESRDDVIKLDAILVGLERSRGMDVGSVKLIPLIETARGVVRCDEIAEVESRRTLALAFGLGDFSVDLGIDPTDGGPQLLYSRSRLVVASRAAGLRRPLDGPYLEFRDLDGLRADSLQSRSLGFEGRIVIHPDQVAPARAAYTTLSEMELLHAKRCVEAFERAEAEGLAAIDVGGVLVDYPIYFGAKRRLAVHTALTAHDDALGGATGNQDRHGRSAGSE